MSTIKSSDEHLTLNADGSSKDIKFQANGVQKASLSSTGVFTATSFAGSGANLTGLPSSGLPLSGGTLTGNLVIGAETDASERSLTINSSSDSYLRIKTENDNEVGAVMFGNASNALDGRIQYDSRRMRFFTAGSERLNLTDDGRGLSQFTAKVWINFNGQNTVSIRDSHNVSSITDHGTGDHTINFSNNLANTNFCSVGQTSSLSGSGTYFIDTSVAYAVGSNRIGTKHTNGDYYDRHYNQVIIFGD